MATVWTPEGEVADAAAAGVLGDEHGGHVALMHLLLPWKRPVMVMMKMK